MRMAAEEDAMRLYNRVRQLEREEQKASKRIEETRRRAKEVLTLRERNERHLREKELRLRELQLEVAQQRKLNARTKAISQHLKEQKQDEITQRVEEVADEVRVERIMLEEEMRKEKILARKAATERKEAVKRAHDRARQKAERRRLEGYVATQQEYENRVEEEAERRRQKERELQEMARMELELIERLQRKQKEQLSAYSELESVLSVPTAQKSSSSVAGGKKKGAGGARGPTTAPAPNADGDGDAGAVADDSGSAGLVASESTPELPPGEPTEEEIAMVFSQYDVEGTGSIPAASLGDLLSALGLHLNEQQLGEATAQLGQSGAVNFGEFLLWWRG